MATWRRLVVLVVLITSGSAGRGQEPSQARAALDEASAAIRAGNYQAALPLAERAVALAESSPDPTVLGRALAELGRTQWGRGQYATARATLDRGLEVFRRLDDASGVAELLMRLGENEFSQGRYESALSHYARALESNARAPVRLREAQIRSNMGSALRFLGRLDEAAAAAGEALGMFRLLGDEAGAGQALTFLGIIHRARADYQKAIAAYSEAIALRQRLGDRRGQAQTLGNLGNVYLDLGDYERAVDAYTRSMAIADEVGYTAQSGFSRANLAAVLADLGRGAEALARMEQALALWRQINRRPEVGRTLRHIGVALLHDRGDAAGARAAFDEALAIAREIKDADLESLTLVELGSLALVQGDAARAIAMFDEGLAIARRSGSPDLEYKLLAERGRTRLRTGAHDAAIGDLRASAAIVNDIRARVTSDEAKIAFLDTRQAVFQDLATGLLEKGQVREALEAAESGRARALADALESRQAGPPGDSSTAVESPLFDEIQATVRRLDATLVEYLLTDSALLAWVVSPDGAIHVARTAVDPKRLAELVRTLVDMMNAPAAPRENPARARAVLSDLHRIAVAPIAAWLPGRPATLLLIVPHGPLALVPFAALEDAGGTPLVSRHSVSVAPSIAMFRYTGKSRRSSSATAAASGDAGSMIFAAPQAPADAGLEPLAGSLDEGRRVALRLSRHAPRLLSGKDATEDRAKRAVGRAKYLHFATHGLVSETRPANSALVLSDGAGEDGYLRAREVYGLQLVADLVVLSGCSTARGRFTGDGVFGLPRAFLYAGAPSVVASLWDVSDRATVSLMDRFYAELDRTSDKAAALRAAQLETRQRYPHPALWAPFILVGEPR